MDEDSKPGWLKWTLGLVGLGAVAGSAAINIWIAVAILIIALLVFGAWFLYFKWDRKRKGQRIHGEVGEGVTQGVSEAEKRAELDALLQRFRTGLKEFDRAGYSVYAYPWFVVIGESGAGKTEAMRSALEDQVPSEVRHHIPPKDKGTKDFVWWFTEHGIVLDTAGRMVVSEREGDRDEAWGLFLRSLRKARPRCPINGLMLAVSAESLIRNSGEEISKKATQLSQKIANIQRELDVRFPVYLLVTKCDLLTGFREFTETIEDPQLQHQIFGWSNPASLDERFQPDSVHNCLLEVVEQVKRRRLALLRPADGGNKLGDTNFLKKGIALGQSGGAPRRFDNDALFAFADSLMLLEPRLKRYLELIFVGGAWSAKPVFLRGIYFTSAMREGNALDEAMSLITGASLDQLPADRAWDRNKSFFLRDLFVEKVTKEKGLVTRAKNTLKALQKRQLLIYGSVGTAMLLLVLFAWFGFSKLNKTAYAERRYWQAAAGGFSQLEWKPPIVRLPAGPGYRFVYAGDEPITELEAEKGKLSVVGFHSRLRDLASTNLRVPLIFRGISFFLGGVNKDRIPAQRAVLAGGVIRPLFERTRDKMRNQTLNPADTVAMQRHQDALLELLRLEGAVLNSPTSKPSTLDSSRADTCLRNLLAYLTETNTIADTNLVKLLAEAYGERWPPAQPGLSGGATLNDNLAIQVGLREAQKAAKQAQFQVNASLTNLDSLVAALQDFYQGELSWSLHANCPLDKLVPKYDRIRLNWGGLGHETTLNQSWQALTRAASSASASPIAREVSKLLAQVPDASKSRSILKEVDEELRQMSKDALQPINDWYTTERKGQIETLDTNLLVGVPPAFEKRWQLYTNACALSQDPSFTPSLADVGSRWTRFQELLSRTHDYEKQLAGYDGPCRQATTNACSKIALEAVSGLKNQYVQTYTGLVFERLQALTNQAAGDEAAITNARVLLTGVEADVAEQNKLEPEDQRKIQDLNKQLPQTKVAVLAALSNTLSRGAGFPVNLREGSNAPARPLLDLVQARTLATLLTSELALPVWGPSAAVLKTKCESLAPILNILIDKGGNSTKWQLSFIGARNSKDFAVVSGLRALRATAAGGPYTVDFLDQVKPDQVRLLGEIPVDAALTLEFKQLPDRPAVLSVKKLDWWLPRFLAGAADPAYDGPGYRFKVQLSYEEGGTTVSGEATFQATPKEINSTPPLKQWRGVGAL